MELWQSRQYILVNDRRKRDISVCTSFFFHLSFHLAENYATTAVLQVFTVWRRCTSHYGEAALRQAQRSISLEMQGCDKHTTVSSFPDCSCGSFILLSASLETVAVPASCRHHSFRHVLNC